MEPWEITFEAMVTAVAQAAFPLLCQGPTYLYYIPSGPRHYGKLVPVADGQEIPDGAVLADPRRIPRNRNSAGIRAFLYPICRTLPILPTDPVAR